MRIHGLPAREVDARIAYLEAATVRELTAAAKTIRAELDGVTVLTAASFPGSGIWAALSSLYSRWRRFVDGVAMPYLAETWREGSRTVIDQAGRDWPDGALPNLGGDLAFEALAAAENRMVGLSTELWENTRVALTEGFELGEGIPELAARVTDAAEVTEVRARAAARTEVARAAHAGTYDTIVAAGFVGRKEWLAVHDVRTRPAHRAADGQRVPIRDTFQIGDPPFPARYPADAMLPPGLSINCRCDAVYDVDDQNA